MMRAEVDAYEIGVAAHPSGTSCRQTACIVWDLCLSKACIGAAWSRHLQLAEAEFIHTVQGKAAIDVVCNPLGKSGGSAIQQVMIIAFGSLSASTPYLGIILLGVVLMWMGAARSLNVQVHCWLWLLAHLSAKAIKLLGSQRACEQATAGHQWAYCVIFSRLLCAVLL